MNAFFSSFVEFFWGGISFFVVLSSLASMELIEKQKQTSKKITNIKLKLIAKTITKVKSKCKNQNKVGLPPNKR